LLVDMHNIDIDEMINILLLTKSSVVDSQRQIIAIVITLVLPTTITNNSTQITILLTI
jgi:hypothetical protein